MLLILDDHGGVEARPVAKEEESSDHSDGLVVVTRHAQASLLLASLVVVVLGRPRFEEVTSCDTEIGSKHMDRDAASDVHSSYQTAADCGIQRVKEYFEGGE